MASILETALLGRARQQKAQQAIDDELLAAQGALTAYKPTPAMIAAQQTPRAQNLQAYGEALDPGYTPIDDYGNIDMSSIPDVEPVAQEFAAEQARGLEQHILAQPKAFQAGRAGELLNQERLGIKTAADIEAKRATAKAERGADPFKAVSLERDINQDVQKAVEPYKQLVDSFRRFDSLFRSDSGELDFVNRTPYDQIGAIFQFMKTLDPSSVVRESEYATAAQAGSLYNRVQNLLASVERGDKLQPAQLAQMYQTVARLGQHADSLAKQEAARFTPVISDYAERVGLNPENIRIYEGGTPQFDAATFPKEQKTSANNPYTDQQRRLAQKALLDPESDDEDRANAERILRAFGDL